MHEGISKSLGTIIVHDYLPLILYWPELGGKDVGGIFILQSTKAGGSFLNCLLAGKALHLESVARPAGAHRVEVEDSPLA